MQMFKMISLTMKT